MTIKESLDVIKNYKPYRFNNQKTYRGQTKIDIYLDYLNGMKKSHIAKKYKLSNSRVDQIIRMCDKVVNYYINK